MDESLCACCLVVVALFASVVAGNGQCTLEVGVDFFGGDINDGNELITNTVEDCCGNCTITDGCIAWSRIRDTGSCWLKSDIISTQEMDSVDSGVRQGNVDQSAVTTASASGVDPCRIEDGIDFYGKDIQDGNKYIVNTPQDCCILCQQTASCVAWTRVKGTGACWLKSSIPTPIIDNKTESGILGIIRAGPISSSVVMAAPAPETNEINEMLDIFGDEIG